MGKTGGTDMLLKVLRRMAKAYPQKVYVIDNALGVLVSIEGCQHKALFGLTGVVINLTQDFLDAALGVMGESYWLKPARGGGWYWYKGGEKFHAKESDVEHPSKLEAAVAAVNTIVGKVLE